MIAFRLVRLMRQVVSNITIYVRTDPREHLVMAKQPAILRGSLSSGQPRVVGSRLEQSGCSLFQRRSGNAYVEYLVLASIVLLATIGFYQSQLQDDQSGVRLSVNSAFIAACESIANSACEPPPPPPCIPGVSVGC